MNIFTRRIHKICFYLTAASSVVLPFQTVGPNGLQPMGMNQDLISLKTTTPNANS